MPYGEVRNVRKVFMSKATKDVGGMVALEDASFDFERGEIVALLGPSGCGKTTLLRMVAGLIDKTAGEIRIGDVEVNGPYSDYGFVFQAPSLMPWRTVLANVLFPMDVLHRNDAAAKTRAKELLRMVGLADFESSRPHQLSGGMQQRVALCRALIHSPKLLLMDEPFGALDELTRLEMNDLLLKVRDQTGASVLFVTHSIAEAVYLGDKVLVFSKRPAKIALEVKVGFPGKRSQLIRFTPEFAAAERRASEALGIIPATSAVTSPIAEAA